MPIYEYKCKKCGAEFEALVRNNQTPECPECKTTDVDKRMSATASGAATKHDTPCGGDCGGARAHTCGCGGACHCH